MGVRGGGRGKTGATGSVFDDGNRKVSRSWDQGWGCERVWRLPPPWTCQRDTGCVVEITAALKHDIQCDRPVLKKAHDDEIL